MNRAPRPQQISRLSPIALSAAGGNAGGVGHSIGNNTCGAQWCPVGMPEDERDGFNGP